MKNRGKRFIVLLLSVLMVMSQMSFVAFATGGETPVTGGETPAAGEETPAGGETPAAGGETPAAGEETPKAGDETPVTGAETPTTGEETPKAGDETPTTGDETPATVAETPTTGEEKPAENGSGKARLALNGAKATAQSNVNMYIYNKTGGEIKLVAKDGAEDYETVLGADQYAASPWHAGLVSVERIYSENSIAVSDNAKSCTIKQALRQSDRAGYNYYLDLSGSEFEDGTTFSVISGSEQCTVTFHKNSVDASGTMDPQMVKKGKYSTLDANQFTRSGYEFIGWSTDKNATEATYYDKDDSFRTSEDVALYAVWQKVVHVHDWNAYNGGNNELYVNCKDPECEYNQKTIHLTLATPDKEYDGTAYDESKITTDDRKPLPDGLIIPSDSMISNFGPEYVDADTSKALSEAPKKAGSYRVTFYLTNDKDDKLGSLTQSFQITKKDLSVTADSGQGKAFGEADPELTYKAEGFVKGDTKAKVLSGSLSRNSGEKVGDYYINQGTLAANGNYEIKFTEGSTFKISRAKAAVVEAPAAINRVYDKKSSGLVTAGKASENCEMVYALEGEAFDDEIPSGLEPDKYTVRFKAVPKEEYEDSYTESEEDSVEVTITPPGVNAPVAKSGLVYNGDEQELVAPGSTDTGSMYYSLNGGGWVKEKVPSGVNAGEYKVVWAVFTDDTPNTEHMITSGEINVTIDKAAITEDDFTAPKAVDDLVYDGSKHEVLQAGAVDPEIGQMQYSLSEDEGYGTDIPEGTAAGEGTVWFRIVPTDNYYPYGPESVPVSIGAKPVSIEWGERVLKYNSREQAPSAVAMDGDTEVPGIVEVSGQRRDVPTSWLELVYIATATLNNSNYRIADGRYAAFTISPKTVDIEWEGDGFPYDGDAHKPTASVTASQVYSVDTCVVPEDGYTIYKDGKQVDAAVNAGTYTAEVTKLSNSNYAPDPEDVREFRITKVALDTQIIADSWVYGEEAKIPTLTRNPEKSDVTWTYYRLTPSGGSFVYEKLDGIPSDVGYYEVDATVAESTNYSETTKYARFSITKATGTQVTLSLDEKWSYGEDAPAPVLTCSVEGVVPEVYYGGTANDGEKYEAWDKAPEKAGSYSAVAIVEGTDNYDRGESNVVNFTIERAERDLEAAVEGWTYGGPSNWPKLSGKGLDESGMQTTYWYKTRDGEDFVQITSPEQANVIPAGRNTLRVKVSQTDNYLADEDDTVLNIGKADFEVKVEPREGLVYTLRNGKPVEWALIGSINGDNPYEPKLPEGMSVEYKTNPLSSWSKEIPTATEAGSYDIWYRVNGGNNYNSYNPSSSLFHGDLTVTIAQAELGEPEVEITPWTYGQYSKKHNAPNVAEGGLPADYDGDVTWYYADVDDEGDIDEDSWTEAIPEQAGDYAVKGILAGSDNYKDTVTEAKKFTVAKAPLTDLSVSVEGWTYGEEPNEPVVEGNLEKGEVTFKYEKKNVDGSYSESEPVEPGTYRVIASVAATQDYAGKEVVSEDFVVAKGEIDPYVSIEGWNYLQYKARFNEPVLKNLPEGIGDNDYWYQCAILGDGITMDNLRDSDYHDILLKDFSELEAGDYAIRAIVKPTTLYEGDTTDPVKLTVGKADLDITVTPRKGLVYTLREDGTPEEWDLIDKVNGKSPYDPELPTGVTIEYSVNSLTDYSTDVPTGTDAGSYRVRYRVNGGKNYNSIDPVIIHLIGPDFTVEIAKADFDSNVSIDVWREGETPSTPSVSNNPENAEVTYSYKKEGADDKTLVEEVPTEPGDYEVVATIGSSDNYNQKVTAPSSFTIYGAPGAPGAKDLTYTGEDQILITTGDARGTGTMKYSLDGKSYVAGIRGITGNNAGDYTVWYYVEGTGEFKGRDTEPQSINVTIKKADLEVKVEPRTGLVYTIGDDGKPVEWALIGSIGGENPYEPKLPDGMSVEFKTNPLSAWSKEIPTATEAGPYDIWYRVNGGNNYNSYNPSSSLLHGDFTVRIEKAAIAGAQVTIDSSWTYGNDPKTPKLVKSTVPVDYDGEVTFLYAAAAEGEDPDIDSYSPVVPEESGSYAVIASLGATKNYKLSYTAPARFTISKAQRPDLSVTIADWAYGDEASEPVVEGNLEDGAVKFEYKKKGDDGNYYKVDKPEAAGDYKVIATVGATANYVEQTVIDKFVISKANVDASVSIEGWTYGNYKPSKNAPKLVSSITINPNVVAYDIAALGALQPVSSLADEDFKPISGDTLEKLDAGRYAVRARANENTNYFGFTTEPTAFRVRKAGALDPDDLHFVAQTAVYDGNEHKLIDTEAWPSEIDPDDVLFTVTESRLVPIFAKYTSFSEGWPKATDAGPYYVWVVTRSDNNITSAPKRFDARITKADINPTVSIDKGGWTYGDDAKTPVVTGNTGEGGESFSYTGKTVAGKTYKSSNAPTAAGEYTVTATIAETANYNGGTASCDFVISKKVPDKPTIMPVARKGLVYNGKAQYLIIIGESWNGTVKYSKSEAGPFTTVIPTGTDADDYNVWYIVDYPETSNYGDTEPRELVADPTLPETDPDRYAITIAKKPIDPEMSIGSWTYGDEPETPQLEGAPETADVKFDYRAKDDDRYKPFHKHDARNIGAGDYVLRATVSETGNYEGGEAYADFSVGKADASAEIVPEKGLVYNGSVQKLIKETTVLGGTLEFKGEDGKYSTDDSVLYQKDAGDYEIAYRVVGDANHKDLAPETLTVSIAPDNVASFTWNAAGSYGYDGKTHGVTASVSNLKEGDQVTVDVSGASARDAGDYTATVTGLSGKDAGNYSLDKSVPTASYKWSISKAKLSVTANDNSISYGAEPSAAGVRYSGFVAGDNAENALSGKLTYSYSYAKNGKPGTYAITPGGVKANNYDITFSNGKLTVYDAERVLVMQATSQGNSKAKLTWNSVTDADSYVVYFAKCDTGKKKYKFKKAATVKGGKLTYIKSKLKKGTSYKFYVKALKNGKVICQSESAHMIAGNVSGKLTNAKALKVKTSSMTLKKGEKATIKATITKYNKKKTLIDSGHSPLLRYISSNTAVAKVNANGTVYGVGSGYCKVYVQTVNGLWKAVTVTVN